MTASRRKNHGSHPTSARPGLAKSALPVITLLALAACGGGGETPAGTSATTAQTSNASKRILAAAPAASGGILINEVVAGAWKGAVDEDGDSEDWVELYNPGTSAVVLTGYGLSNKATSPFLWTFPSGTTVSAKGYLTVWLSKKDRKTLGAPLHTSFNLDSGADPVFLTASNATATGIAVDSATAPLLRADKSWCRMPNGVATAAFAVCETPTRNAANSGTASATILAKPVFSVPSGFYGSAQTVSITGPAGASLRYTTDGSEPTTASTAYVTPLTISTATVLRVAAFAAGSAPSLVETGTFVVDATLASRYTGLKAMMVAVAPSDYTAFQANDQTRDFRASFELITGGTTSVFKMDAEGSAGGQLGSGSSPQRTMNVKAVDAFGAKAFPGVLWPDKPGIKSSKKLRLRNGSNDWDGAHLRDQLSQRLGGDSPNILASSSSVALFVNGKYYGLMDLREREEETIPSANLGIDKDWVDYIYDPLLGAQEIKNGGAAALANYQAMHNFVTGNDMSVPANYTRAKTLLNPESLAWDWALHMFHANYDWPHRNVHVWRSPEVDSRWTWRAHDMDFAFGRYAGVDQNMNGSFAASGSGVISGLLRNTEFRNLYLNTVADQMNIMTPSIMSSTLDNMAAEMRPYIADFYSKNGMGAASVWEGRVNAVRTWINQREQIYDAHNRTQFNLGARQPISVSVNDISMGGVKVNQVATQKYITAASPTWTGKYYPGVPVSLEAKPKPGFAFVGWQGASTATERRITQTLAATASNFPADFSVRWSGALEAPVSGTAQLQTVADDGIRLWFDGQLVIDNWVIQAATARNATVNLVAGRRHTVVVEYYDQGGLAVAKLNWQLPGASTVEPVPVARLYPQGAPASAEATGRGLTAQYFANITLAGTPSFVRNEAINFDWQSTAPTVTADPVQLTAVFAPAGTPGAPVVAAIPAQTRTTGEIVSLTVTATDPGGYDLTYAAKTLPKGLNINPANGVIYGRLTTPGTYTTTVTATNGVSSGTQAISWTVTDRPGTGLLGTSPDSGTTTPPPANTPPAVSLTSPSAGASVQQGTAVTISANASDSDGNVARVEFYDGAALLGASTSAPYAITWTNAAVGSHTLSARAIDNTGSTTDSLSVTVSVVGTATSTPPADSVSCAAENQACALPAGSAATVWYGAASSWVQRAGQTGSVACNNATFGDPLVGTIKACRYVVTSAGPANQPPAVGLTAPLANTSLTLGGTLSLSANASDADGNVARVEFYAGTTLIGSDATAPYNLTWTPTVAGAYALTARAFDNAGASSTSAAVALTVTAPPPPPNGTGTGLLGRYFANNRLSGTPVLQRTEAINFNWGQSSPGAGVPADNFSVRWVGQLEALAAGTYQLQTLSDDGVRVWIDGRLVINNWTEHAPTLNASGAFTLQAGQRVSVAVEYQELRVGAVMQLQWKTPGSTVFAAVPAQRLYPIEPTGSGLKGQYFSSSTFAGTPALTRIEMPAVALGSGAGPINGFATSGWGIRWEGRLVVPQDGTYMLRTTNLVDDGVRVWINGVLVIDNWATPSTAVRTASLSLVANAAVSIKIEFRDAAGSANLALDWQAAGATGFQPLPSAVLKPL